MGAIGLLVLSGRAEIWHFLVAQLVAGAAMAFTGPASVGLMPSLVPGEHAPVRQLAPHHLPQHRLDRRPPVAGVLIATSSAGWALAADGLTFLVSASSSPGCPARPATWRPAPASGTTSGTAGRRSPRGAGWC